MSFDMNKAFYFLLDFVYACVFTGIQMLKASIINLSFRKGQSQNLHQTLFFKINYMLDF